MSAVCYTGPPIGTTRTSTLNRFKYFIVARVLRKKFLAWTQSYGPFSTPTIRFLARIDLKRQPIVFCRGEDCREAMEELLPAVRTETFPDVAVSLDHDHDWGVRRVAEYWPQLRGDLVTLSPSAVLYQKSLGDGSGNDHVRAMAALTEDLIAADRSVLLVPHTLRPDRHDPNICDWAVAELVRKVVDDPRCAVEGDDLSPTELKSVISTAHIHIGARYHSVVAALSTGVPCLSLSWHAKYRDLMRMYGVERFVVDGTHRDAAIAAIPLLELLFLEHDQIRHAHAGALSAVERNGALFSELMESGQ